MPTVVLVIALPALLALGKWQINRHHWKTELLTELAETASAPLLDLGNGPIPPNHQFRHVSLTLKCPEQRPGAQAGRNLQGAPGYAYTLRCHAREQQIKVLIGWAAHPNEEIAIKTLEQPWQAQGIVVETATATPPLALVLTDAISPLKPVAPPNIDTLPNNHLLYAVQWFSFAGILLVIYLVYLWHWCHKAKLAPPPSEG